MTGPIERAAGLLLAALAVLTGGYGAGFWVLNDPGPPASAFIPAARVVREGWQEGDLIVLVPFYATRARELLGDLEPVAPRDPLAEDFRAHRRVWIFGLFGEAEALRPSLDAAGLALEYSFDPAPGITVDLWRVESPWTVAYDFRTSLKKARVFHEHADGRIEKCETWTDADGQGGTGGRWACPHDAEWFYVSSEWHRMGDHPRRCLWAHPPSEGRLVIQYPGVPLTAHLAGHGGHTLNSSLYARERIDLDVAIGDAAPQRFAIGLKEYWRPFALKTAVSGATTATVTFAVSSPDAGANHFCFTAQMREAPLDPEPAPEGVLRLWRLR